MVKSIITRFGAISLVLMAFQANAAVINGMNYKAYTGKGSVCPDGKQVLVYNNVRYCQAYRANISWSLPTTRTNGSALTASELTGYEVYWTRASDNAKGTLKISGGTKSSTAFDVYTPGTYYFAISALDSKGLKSPLSAMVQASLGK